LSILFFAASAAAFSQSAVPTAVAKNTPAKAQVIPKGSAEPARNRGVAAGEAVIIDVCRSYVDAQLNYLGSVHNPDGFPAFAQRIRSTPGKRDGLYWPLDAGEDESPMGPNFAAAAITEAPPADNAHPFFGYYFKILLSQGPEASGGARDYRVNGRLIAGFALVAWPAEYGVTGVRSFLINHLGDVYAKDLGPDTERAAAGMSAFAPDRSWAKVGSDADAR
jgi:hypothetical protein